MPLPGRLVILAIRYQLFGAWRGKEADGREWREVPSRGTTCDACDAPRWPFLRDDTDEPLTLCHHHFKVSPNRPPWLPPTGRSRDQRDSSSDCAAVAAGGKAISSRRNEWRKN